MQAFAYRSVTTVADARAALLADPRARLIAGGTTLVDLMKAGVEEPSLVVDINGLPLDRIEFTRDRVRIGALARNADIADDTTIAREFPVLTQALLAGASGALRNMATVGGNLLQRTRCPYFRDVTARCNKRIPASGCDAREGYHRTHAILGTSDACIAAHPSDMTAALAALDAQIVIARGDDEVRLGLDDFYLLPGDRPQHESTLQRGDLIVAVELRCAPLYRRSHYLKLRDRASYEFALVSVAACLDVDDDGTILHSRVALGGIATVPWRAQEAERVLDGARAEPATFARAATAELERAAVLPGNAFKVELMRRAIVRTLRVLAQTA